MTLTYLILLREMVDDVGEEDQASRGESEMDRVNLDSQSGTRKHSLTRKGLLSSRMSLNKEQVTNEHLLK